MQPFPQITITKIKKNWKTRYENWHLYAEAASTSDAYDWVERIKKAAYAARKLNKFLAFDDPWFVGTLADAEVKQQLESANIGDFLVRQSPRKPTDFCLHVKKSPAKTTSFPIDERDGCFQIRSNRTSNPKVKEACDIKFKTLAQMIKVRFACALHFPRICLPPTPPPLCVCVYGRACAHVCVLVCVLVRARVCIRIQHMPTSPCRHFFCIHSALYILVSANSSLC